VTYLHRCPIPSLQRIVPPPVRRPRTASEVRQSLRIVNDASRFAVETVGNARYPLLRFQRVITVSIETMEIVRALPRLDFNTLS
jgi:hypothetical protein